MATRASFRICWGGPARLARVFTNATAVARLNGVGTGAVLYLAEVARKAWSLRSSMGDAGDMVRFLFCGGAPKANIAAHIERANSRTRARRGNDIATLLYSITPVLFVRTRVTGLPLNGSSKAIVRSLMRLGAP